MAGSYEILGVPRTATKEQIKKAYKKLSMIYHPDRPTGNKDMFILISGAYEELMKPDVTKIHQQYQYKVPPYATIIYETLDHKGLRIYVECRNLIHAETIGSRTSNISWQLYGLTGGHFEIPMNYLHECNYMFDIAFTTIGGSIILKQFRYKDPRSWWRRLWQRFRIKYDIYWP